MYEAVSRSVGLYEQYGNAADMPLLYPLEAAEYECAYCRGIFTKGWPDEDARSEAEKLFGKGVWDDDPQLICDDCHKLMGLS